MNTPSKVWVESLTAHLELASQVARKLPANERLEVQDLNKILELLDQTRTTFLIMCELHGFILSNEPNK